MNLKRIQISSFLILIFCIISFKNVLAQTPTPYATPPYGTPYTSPPYSTPVTPTPTTTPTPTRCIVQMPTTIPDITFITIQLQTMRPSTQYYFTYRAFSDGDEGAESIGTTDQFGNLTTNLLVDFLTPFESYYYLVTKNNNFNFLEFIPGCRGFVGVGGVGPSPTPIAPPTNPSVPTSPTSPTTTPPGVSSGGISSIGPIPTKPAAFVQAILKLGVGIVGGLAFLLLLFGSFRVLTSAGSPEALNEGREIIVSAIAGLIFVIFSVVLLKIIGVDILQIPDFKTGGFF